MTERDLLTLRQSWPLWEQGLHFDLGHLLNCAVADALDLDSMGALGVHHAGLWECDLGRDDELTWSGGVFDIFGLERGTRVTREKALAQYCELSRTKLEQLRAHAIRHRRGFTLDVDIRAASVGERRSMRIIGVPVYDGETATRLHGLKFLI